MPITGKNRYNLTKAIARDNSALKIMKIYAKIQILSGLFGCFSSTELTEVHRRSWFVMKRLSIFILIPVLSGLCRQQANGDILHVPSAPNPTIQSAINNAKNGDTIIVQPGTYRENINFIGKAITLKSQDPNDPNIAAATIIDGNQPADPNKGSVVTFSSGEKNNSVLAGFTITGGTGSWILVSWQYKGLNWNRCGGGALCNNMSEPTIKKNIFTNNFAGQGGGIYAYGNPVNPDNPANPPVHVKPVIADNTFFDNRAVANHGFMPPDNIHPHNDHGDGGAFVAFQGCDPCFTGNIIQNNLADFYGGGIHLRQWSNGLIQQNYFLNNSSELGGGIHITYNSSPTVNKNIIKQNITWGLGGGGIYVYNCSNPVISYNILLQNDANGAKGGGIGVFWDSQPDIFQNIIAKNTSRSGGGIYSNSGPLNISYNTIAENSATTGSGICLESADPVNVAGNIVAANTGSAHIYGDDANAITAAYNNVWSRNTAGFGGSLKDLTGANGNISADPKFADADSNDYSITVYSPCVNAGDPNFVMQPNQKDINGDDRVIGQSVDIGADETWPIQNITKQTKYIHIQDAINQSNNGDTIIVGRGRFFETLNFGNHQIVLSSADPNDWGVVEQTIIDANHTGTAVAISGGQDANTIFKGFTITNGNATNGHAGGIWCYAAPRIERNIIRNNYASYKGGGMYFWNTDAHPLVTDNKIIENTAQSAGGIFCDSSSRATLANNFISANRSLSAGGGIYFGGCGPTKLINNIISSNYAKNGAGIYMLQATDNVSVLGNLFAGNCASVAGGAIQIDKGYFDIINNTIVANRAPAGSGIYLTSNSSPNIVNNIVAFNEPDYGIRAKLTASDPNFISNDFYANQPGNYGPPFSDQTGFDGNISIDPNFVDNGYWDDANTPADANDDFFVPGDYHIRPGSPCFNTGDTNLVPAVLTEDFDGEQRIFAGAVDIGADEIVITSPFDLNNDGRVDCYELQILAEEWLQSGTSLRTDFHKDNFIDFRDLAELANNWFWQAFWYQ